MSRIVFSRHRADSRQIDRPDGVDFDDRSGRHSGERHDFNPERPQTMGDFFHGWRRKTGCVTLVMACAICVVWLRGLTVHERGLVPASSRSIFWVENGDGLFNIGVRHLTHNLIDIHPILLESHWIQSKPEECSPRENCEIGNRQFGVGYCGLFTELGDSRRAIAGGEFFSVQVAPVIVPLTLLSAFLLLSKPRSAKRAAVETQSLPSSQP